MTPIVIDDEWLRARLDATAAVSAMRRAMADAERGALVAPPRVVADLGPGQLVFTAGARPGDWFGYRSYDTYNAGSGTQVAILHDWRTGSVQAVAIGNELGPRRTGAIGGAAVGVLARSDASEVAMIGAGTQAWAQLWAINAVRPVGHVQVWSRSPAHRERFTRRASEELGVTAAPARSAEHAVRGADIVVLATTSPVPVIDPAWVTDGTHITSLGPKQHGRSEFGPDLAERADVIATDSLGQARAYKPPFCLAGTRHMDRMVSVGAVIQHASPGRTAAGQVTLFCSVGLAGTEVYLLAETIRRQQP